MAAAGIAAALGWLGWLAMLLYALFDPVAVGDNIKHSYVSYLTSNMILVGAEIYKIVSILAVTAILAVALVRARRMLTRGVTDSHVAADLTRFVAPEVAQRIATGETRVRAAGPGFACAHRRGRGALADGADGGLLCRPAPGRRRFRLPLNEQDPTINRPHSLCVLPTVASRPRRGSPSCPPMGRDDAFGGRTYPPCVRPLFCLPRYGRPLPPNLLFAAPIG